jgi:hypothetical protein
MLLSAAAGARAASAAPPLEQLLPAPPPTTWSERFGPTGSPASVPLGHLVVQANLWNLNPRASGSAAVVDKGGTLSWTIDLAGLCPLFHTPRCPAPLDYINGYPDVAYGQSPYGGPNSAAAFAPLPARLGGRARDLWLSARYAVARPRSPMDFEWDIWLTPQATTAHSRGPTDGIEVEIRLYQSFVLGELTRLRFHYAGTVCLPTVVDGALRSWCWKTYHGPSDSAGGMALVIFVPEHRQRRAGIAVNLTGLVQAISAHARALGLIGDGCHAAGSCYVDYIELGSEFAGRLLDRSRVAWSLSAYCAGLLPADAPGSAVTAAAGGC